MSLILVGAVRWSSSYRPAPLLTAAPVRALIDEQTSIKGQFLPPRSPVTVCARMHNEDGDLWEAFAHYNTNANGTFNCEFYSSVCLFTVGFCFYLPPKHITCYHTNISDVSLITDDDDDDDDFDHYTRYQ